MEAPRVSTKVFVAIQTMDVDALESCSDQELRPGESLQQCPRLSEMKNEILTLYSKEQLLNSYGSII